MSQPVEIPEMLAALCRESLDREPEDISEIQAHASKRTIFRLNFDGISVVGVYNEDLQENRAFISFSHTFGQLDLPVPTIYAASDDLLLYLQEDLGDETLYTFLEKERKPDGQISDQSADFYRQSVVELQRFQIEAADKINYEDCHQRRNYDLEAIETDWRYFTQEYLSRTSLASREESLTTELKRLFSTLDGVDRNHFLYRDFQARNIMITDGQLRFIDYQAGRRGPLQYDLASLLYQSQAGLSEEFKQELLEIYLARLEQKYGKNRSEFEKFFPSFVVVRLIQVLGAYGKLGLGEGKPYFKEGIPAATRKLYDVLTGSEMPVELPEFTETLGLLADEFGK